MSLDLSFTLTPALVMTALVFDVGLVLLGVAIVRHMREHRRPQSSEPRRESIPSR